MSHAVRRVNKLRCCIVNVLHAPIIVITIHMIRISAIRDEGCCCFSLFCNRVHPYWKRAAMCVRVVWPIMF